jgi:FAD/FMN-containing dehydrogenase
MAPNGLSRRRFLTTAATAAGVAVTGGVAGLHVRANAAELADPIDLDGLQAALTGQLLRPGDSAFGAAAQPWNLALPARVPAAVALVADRADVVACIQRAGGRGVPLAARSGGHNYAGYSTPDGGVVVDVSALNAVTVNDDGTAVVGAGTRLIDLYSALAASDRALPSGTCPTVGIAGITLGGGIGMFARAYGLTSDHLTAATVVTADGAVHTVDAARDADLHWALRGGGGGNAGIVTDFTFSTVPAPTVVTFSLAFAGDLTPTVLSTWSAWVHASPEQLTSVLSVNGGGPATNRITGTWIGPSSGAATQLSALIAAVGADPTSRTTTNMTYLDAMKFFAGCADRTVSACHLNTTPGGVLRPAAFRAASRIVPQAITEQDAGTIVSLMNDHGDMALLFDSIDGQVAQVGATETAFPHRSAQASVQIYSGSANSEDAVNQVQQALTPVIGAGSYVNYVNPLQTDWATSYWGPNLPRLRQIVSSYDPTGVFTFPQSVLRT